MSKAKRCYRNSNTNRKKAIILQITSKNVWIDERFVPATIEIENGLISSIREGYSPVTGTADFADSHIIPGLIEIHAHGYGGGGATDGDPEVYRRWQAYMPREGVTTFLIGTQTSTEEKMEASLCGVGQVKKENRRGAFIHGVFLQGPYLSKEYPGAYDVALVKRPSVEEFKFYNELSGGNIRTVSIAPETDENHALLKYCVSQGIRVCLGFSGCSYEEAERAIDEGASNVIHCFNCMAPIHHRHPPLSVAAMTDDRVFCEVMTDGLHVHPSITNLVGRMKGKDRLITVTDSVDLKGLKPGLYGRGGKMVRLHEDGRCTVEPSGAPAGTGQTMIQNIMNLQKIGRLPLVTAINAATINPARMLGINDEKGLIKQGYQADLAIYDDEYHIVQTYVHGEPML